MPASILSVKTFTLAELEKATDKFSLNRVLGEGGFGRVYHGILEDRTEVAVKVLSRDNNQNGDREFIAEVEMLSRLHHRNLVKLIGICSEERTRSLVYEIVRNGSVESHLHGILFISLTFVSNKSFAEIPFRLQVPLFSLGMLLFVIAQSSSISLVITFHFRAHL